MDGGKEVPGEFIEALCQASQIFHPAEEPLHQIALTIKLFIIGLWTYCVRAVWNDRHRAIIDNGLPVRGAVIRFVCT